MTPEIILVLLIVVVTVILLVTEWLRADVAALLVMLTLIFTGLLTAEEGLAGFSNPATLTVIAVFIISAALSRSGVAEIIARRMMNITGNSERRVILLLMVGVGLLSSVMNNIGAVAIFIPVVTTIGRKLNIPSSKLLMPVAFAALLGGNLTLIGTPPNILAVEIMAQNNLEPFRFFDFVPTGGIVLVVGILYTLSIGLRILPQRQSKSLDEKYEIREFLTEVRVSEQSSLVGQRVQKIRFGEQYGVNLVWVQQTDGERVGPLARHRVEVGDTFLLEGPPQNTFDLNQDYRLTPEANWDSAEWKPSDTSDEFQLAEITLAPQSRFENRNLQEIRFRSRYGLNVLAIRQHGEASFDYLRAMRIGFGDSLLVQGDRSKINGLSNDPNWLLLESPAVEVRRFDKAPLALLILAITILIAFTGVFPIAPVILAGAMGMVLSGIIDMNQVYRAIDWRVVFLVAALLPLGTAMQTSGTATYIAETVVQVTGDMGPIVVMAAMFLITALLTQVISNAATTVLIIPIIISIASDLGVNAQPLIMSTILAASTAFILPFGHQVTVLIYGVGGYRIRDYIRVGTLLTLLIWIVTIVVVPVIWQF